MSESRADVKTYFSGLAETYARHRPSYAPGAIDAMIEGLPSPVRAADVGCGTGISTRLLAARGVHVIGIEPNADMRRQAQRDGAALPIDPAAGTIDFRDGTAEQTGLADATVHLVLCAQAFHWFDAPAALREFRRILQPQGRLALMWNIREDRDPFSAEFNRLTQRAQIAARQTGKDVRRDHAADPIIGGHFTNGRLLPFDNPQVFDLPGVLGRVRSASYWPAPGLLRDELESALRRAFEAHQRDGAITVEQRTELTLADRA